MNGETPARWVNVFRAFVSGVPIPKGSMSGFVPRGARRAILTMSNGKTLRPWAATVGAEARIAWGSREPILGPVRIFLRFRFPRLKSHFGTGKNAAMLKPNAPVFIPVKPDGDKIDRAVWDALTGITYRDDAQIVSWGGEKVYSDPGLPIGVWIEISELAQ